MINHRELLKATGGNKDKLRKLVAKMKRDPHRFFIPNKAQADAARAVGTLSVTPDETGKTIRIFLFTSGNGVGKTTITANILANLIYPEKNFWRDIEDVETGEKYSGFFDYPLFKRWPLHWPKVIWVISNNESIKSVIRKTTDWFRPGSYNELKEGKNHTSKITFKYIPDWVIQFKTVDQPLKTYESEDVGAIVCDEPPTRKIFQACISRLRNGGIILIPATALFEAGWFSELIIDRIKEDGDKYHQKVSVWTNCVEKAGLWKLGRWGKHAKGNLFEADIDFQLRNYDPDELPARRDGEIMFWSGVVYKVYSKHRDRIFKSIPAIAHPHYYMYRMIIDPHDRKPPAVAWVRFDKFGRRSYIREWPSREDPQYGGRPFHELKDAGHYTIRDFCKFWIEIEEMLGIPPDRISRIIDPNFGNRVNRGTGKLIHEEYSAASKAEGRSFAFITDCVDDLAYGHKAVKALLQPFHTGDLPMEIDDGCYNIDYALRHYMHDERTPKEEEKHGVTEKVREYGKDFVDLLRYDAVVPFTWIEPRGLESGWDDDYGEREKKKNWRDRIPRPPGAAGV